MRLQVKGRNVEVSPAIREYAETKLARLDKQLADGDRGRGRALRGDEARSQHTAEATVFAKGPTLRASESTSDIRASIDKLVDEPRAPGRRATARSAASSRAGAPSTTALEPLPPGRAAARPARARGRASTLVGEADEPTRRRRGTQRASTASTGPREWDAVTTVDAPELDGDRVEFVAAARPASSWSTTAPTTSSRSRPRSSASFAPPYRAEAVRRDGELWAVAARKIEVVDASRASTGEEIELSSHDGERTLVVDGEQVVRLDPGARAARARRRGPAGSTATPGRSRSTRSELVTRRRWLRAAAARWASRYPVIDARHDGFEKFLRFGEGRRMKRLAASRRRTSRRSSPSSRRSPTTSCARRRPSSASGSTNGEELDNLLFEAYAAVREARLRESDQRMFDVQMMGGIVLHEGDVAEMKTGEGKTFVASLALYLNALPTVDDPRRPHPRPGRPPRHRQRLPRPARRRVEPRRLRAARHDGRASSRR